jgi:CBS domain-containing protein
VFGAQPPFGELSNRRLAELLGCVLVACPRGTSVKRAAELMAEADTGSIVVLGANGTACGILTDSDLRRRVVAAGRGPDTPVDTVMSSPLLSVPPATLFFEALSLMLERHIHHLVVAEDGRALGVVSESDLVSALGVGPLFLVRRIDGATSVEQLSDARAALPRMVGALLTAGVGAYDLARIIAETTDRLVRRAVGLAEAELGQPPLPYCWLALGSEGRREQTLHTDQDHALVYADPDPEQAESARVYFLRLAERVVDALTRCGLPHCPGEVMASNPRWNQPLAAWRAHFTNWIERPASEALLNASIFFDLRPIAGEASFGTALQDQIARQAPAARRFQLLLADQARHNRPPLGLFRKLVVQRSGDHRGQLDLKHGGLSPVVDLARLYALRHGVRETNTIERLRTLAKLRVLPAETPDELVAAYEFILLLRIRGHVAHLAKGRETDNYVAPDEMERVDRTLLKEHLAVIATAQQALESEFSTYLLG